MQGEFKGKRNISIELNTGEKWIKSERESDRQTNRGREREIVIYKQGMTKKWKVKRERERCIESVRKNGGKFKGRLLIWKSKWTETKKKIQEIKKDT